MKRSYFSEVQEKIEAIGKQMDVSLIAYVGSSRQIKYPIYCVNTKNRGARRVLLSAGIHGDEPAGVYALIEFLHERIHDYTKDINFSIFPCLNPWGFERDLRFNVNGTDINRCFVRNTSRTATILKKHIAVRSGYSFAITLHEDNTSMKDDKFPNPQGFYLYETPLNGQHLGLALARKLRERGVELCRDREIYGEQNQEGVVINASNDGEFEGFLQLHTKDVLAIETPTCWTLERRVQSQIEAICTALELIK
jgi:murein peptide amidase A